MASKNMKKMKRLLSSNYITKEEAFIRFETNAYKVFERDFYKKEMAGWPSHFTKKRVK